MGRLGFNQAMLPVWLKEWRRPSGWNEWMVLVGMAMFSIAVWGFVELADDAPEGDYMALESKILRAFRQPTDPAIGIGPAWLPEAARDLTAMGSAVTLSVLVLLVLGWLILRRRYRTALFVLLATIGGVMLGHGLKVMFGRERPTIVPHLMEESSLSFPSGHSMMSSVVYLTLGALLARSVPRRREKIYLVTAAAGLSVAIGISRVYMGVHYPTDVLAGWSAGTAWALFCGVVAWWLQRRGNLSTPPGDDTPRT